MSEDDTYQWGWVSQWSTEFLCQARGHPRNLFISVCEFSWSSFSVCNSTTIASTLAKVATRYVSISLWFSATNYRNFHQNEGLICTYETSLCLRSNLWQFAAHAQLPSTRGDIRRVRTQLNLSENSQEMMDFDLRTLYARSSIKWHCEES